MKKNSLPNQRDCYENVGSSFHLCSSWSRGPQPLCLDSVPALTTALLMAHGSRRGLASHRRVEQPLALDLVSVCHGHRVRHEHGPASAL